MEMKLKIVPIFQYMYHETESATKVFPSSNLLSIFLKYFTTF